MVRGLVINDGIMITIKSFFFVIGLDAPGCGVVGGVRVWAVRTSSCQCRARDGGDAPD